MSSPYQTGATDPRLLASNAIAKAKDVEARLNTVIGGLNAVPPSIVYTTNSVVVSQNANGVYTWACPAGVTSAYVECWGAGAGAGGGGTSRGGEGGGSGEYAAEPAYPLVGGTTYTYSVGNGGNGGTTGYGGQSGQDTIFDTTGIGLAYGVFANAGSAGSGYVGGSGGGTGGTGNTPSPNSIVHSGAPGGGNGSQGTGGCGGGGSGGPTTGGTGGSTSGSSTGAGGGGAGGSPGGAGGSGGNNAANGSNGGSPGGGGGGAGASTSATSGQNQYRMSSSATYYGNDAQGGAAGQLRGYGTMYQGGETASGGAYNGTMKSAGIIGGSPSSDLSGKTIDQVTIRLEWLHCWYNTGAYVILGYAPFNAWGQTWSGGDITPVKTYWQGSAADQSGGGPVTADLTGTNLGSALQSGAAQSITFGPGSPAFDLYNYGYFYGAGGDNNQNPLITVNWHTGSAPVQAGAGRDGMVRITYSVSGVLAAALQPAAGTDATGNAFAQGYTGPVSAVQPGSAPAVIEVPHTVSYLNSWTAAGGIDLKYMLMPDGTVRLSGRLNAPTVTTNLQICVIGTSAYWPVRQIPIYAVDHAGSPYTNTAHLCLIGTSGQLVIYGPITAGNTVEINATYSLAM